MPTKTTTATETTTPTYSTLAEALLAFQADMPHVGKTETATIPTKGGGSYAYKYADIGGIVDAVMPRLNGFGLTFSHRSVREADGTYSLVGVLRFAPTNEEDTASLPIYTKGTNQEMGSSVTYGRRYTFQMLTGIVTEADDDGALASAAPARLTAEQEAQEARDKAQAARNTAEYRAGARFRAMNPQATKEQFEAAVVEAFAQPYEDITAEQFDSYLVGPPPAGDTGQGGSGGEQS